MRAIARQGDPAVFGLNQYDLFFDCNAVQLIFLIEYNCLFIFLFINHKRNDRVGKEDGANETEGFG
jgi:hypothetical protein